MKVTSLIVVGTPFSGAALLGHTLGAHSQVFFAGELWRLWDRGADSAARACRDCGSTCATWGDPAVVSAVANGPAAVSAALAATTGRRLVVEGPVTASALAARLARGEPSSEDARIVLCVCDPLLYVRKRAGVTEDSAKRRAAEWRDEQSALVRAALSSGRPLLVVRYEDLANRMEETLARVCEFAGLACEPTFAPGWDAPTHAIGAKSEAWGVAEPAHSGPDQAASSDPRERRVETLCALDREPAEALGLDITHAVFAELRPTRLCETFGYEPRLPAYREPWDDAERQRTAAWVKDELRRTREAVLDDRADDAITILQMLVDHFGPAFDDLGLESKYENLALVLVDLLHHQQRSSEALPYARALVRHAPHNPEAHRLLAAASPGSGNAPTASTGDAPQVQKTGVGIPDRFIRAATTAHPAEATCQQAPASASASTSGIRAGHLDICMQSHCAGWAVEDGQPAALELFLNGSKLADVRCDVDRPDLVAHGFPRGSGFSVNFPRPLNVEDVVDVRFGRGGSLVNSPTSRHAERLRLLLEGVSATEPGLEVGPLDRPLLGKRDYNVLYVDHANRADLIAEYRSRRAAYVRPDSIVDVDFVWAGRLTDIAGHGYAYCLASHVIEHVADPIGWLGEIAEALRPAGRLNLTVPEATRTFDHRRALSTPAALLDAHHRKLCRPSFAQIFDCISGASPLEGPEPDRLAAIQDAYRAANEAMANGAYVDTHCHVWTHQSFLECWSVIDALGLLPLSLARLTPPIGDWNEFTVSFVRN